MLTRRTFAIISHPDAGKTTLTEKLLAEAGAVRLAGQVRARGEGRRTRSDWMEMERKRGISISSSVMTFEYRGLTFNLLDTPGHQDFSEDTYRTLTAVDSAVMVIDAAKGIEAQTLKLFEVCRLRNIPIITFVNKVDREGLGPLAIMDEIADRLALDVTPVLWPLSEGTAFSGCLDTRTGKVVAPDATHLESIDALRASGKVRDEKAMEQALEQLELAQIALPAFDLETYRAGHLTPVFFGSALTDVGVRELLDAIADWAPSPQPQPAEPAPIEPTDPETTGFVFKVQANMDPNHRDRIAFLRLCSGKFYRGQKLRNVRTGKELAVSNPMFFFAQERQLADEAVAGDVIGIPNHGTLSVGDTLTAGSTRKVTGIPNFAPELIRRVRLPDAMRAKQLAKALSDLGEEGVAQVFRPSLGSDWLVGVVGPLQLDVLSLAPRHRIRRPRPLRGRRLFGRPLDRLKIRARAQALPRRPALGARLGRRRLPGLPRARPVVFWHAPQGLARNRLRDDAGTGLTPSEGLLSRPPAGACWPTSAPHRER